MRRAQLQNGRGVGGDQRRPFGPGGVIRHVQQPREHAPDVAVDGRDRQVESDGTDGADGVRSQSGERAQEFFVGGQRFQSGPADEPSGAAEVAGAAVIAQPLPAGQNVVFACRSERRQRGKTFHPARVKAFHPFDLGLLEHGFGDEDMVGIAVEAPGQVALVGIVPCGQRFGSFEMKLFGAHRRGAFRGAAAASPCEEKSWRAVKWRLGT